jgi:hypothetical protein
MTVGIDRFKASSHPTQQQGVYLGVIKTVTPDKKAYVYIPKFLNTVGPMRCVSGFLLLEDTMVLCAHVGGGNEEMYIIGSVNDFAYKVGDTGPGGGIIFFVDRFNEYSGFTYLEVAPVGTQISRTWATNVNLNRTTAVSGADSRTLGAGYQNTIDIVAQTGNVAATCAAKYCADLVSGGKSDWYLPSLAEIKMVYDVVHVNLGVGDFNTDDTYWSSSEKTASLGLNQDFNGGYQGFTSKGYTTYVRAVRRF